MGQAVGCPTHTNFVVPSAGRQWAQVYNIHERGLAQFCTANQAGIPGALAQKGAVQFDRVPGGGQTGIAFSSATPHYGVGAAGVQTSMVFFAGAGAAAYLSKPGAPSAKFFNGQDSGGALQRGCHKDAVMPISDVLATIEPAGAATSEAAARKLGQPASLLCRV